MAEGPKRTGTSRSRASTAPAWRSKFKKQDELDEEKGPTKIRRDPTSIWDHHLPHKRYARRLSSTAVGLAGNSPKYAEMNNPSRTREQRCKDEIAMKLEMGSIHDLWMIYIQSSAWHQDDGEKWPIQNDQFVKVRKRIAVLLKKRMQKALESDSLEDLEAVVREADGKVQLLAVQSNDKFRELDQIFARIEVKREEERRRLKGIVDGGAPTLLFSDKEKSRQSLTDALESMQIEDISRAVYMCIQGGVDVTDAIPHIGITSKYFAPEGDRATSLFPAHCFNGEGRCIHIVNLGPEMDLNRLQRLCSVSGVDLKYHTDPAAVMVGKEERKSGTRKGTSSSIAASLNGKETKFESKVLKDPHLHTIVFISGPEPARLEGDTATLEKLLMFNKAGGGVMIIGSGNRGGNSFPLIRDANILLQLFGLDKMWGHDAAEKILQQQSARGKPGFNAAHPLLADIPQLDEGFSIAGLDESFLKRGFRELVRRASTGKLLTCIREPSRAFAGDGGAGPLCVHASPAQLLCSKYAVGAEQWVTNLLLYMCLRTADVGEIYLP
eukprot:CAMPEP_0115371664 /NCGR_PEP_ID=MMETSP0271-20121206/501_1 /TAXON_ID=71861 /ORGANISM="Scrippsiella trochoidea, Strain CCMP3099" /LENGTH=551 /DNA_ID=CAMNT_0002794579 /DNA_START=49 /DNA_END=1704 /DNA_ORIENTATION=-